MQQYDLEHLGVSKAAVTMDNIEALAILMTYSAPIDTLHMTTFRHIHRPFQTSKQ